MTMRRSRSGAEAAAAVAVALALVMLAALLGSCVSERQDAAGPTGAVEGACTIPIGSPVLGSTQALVAIRIDPDKPGTPRAPWDDFLICTATPKGQLWDCRVAIRDLSTEERRIVIGMLVVAAVLRLAVVAGLFLTTNHFSVPFGSLFGDEEYFKRRSLWLRSMALGNEA